MSDSTPLTLPEYDVPNHITWGPTISSDSLASCLGSMDLYPFDITPKPERLGRVCDFAYYTSQKKTDTRFGGNAPDEETDFQLVDSRPLKSSRYQIRRRILARRPNMQQQQQQQQQMPMQQHARNAQMNSRYYQQQQRRQQLWQITNRLRQLVEWSIEPKQEWELVDTIQTIVLPKIDIDSSKIEYQDIHWFGELHAYNKVWDRVLPKNRVHLNDSYIHTLSFYWPSTSEDPYLINQFQSSDDGIIVAATDQILACLMAAAQSRFSWHLLFHKTKNRIIMDKQTGTSIDLLTVGETSREPPLSDHSFKHNRPVELGAEAIKINQNFSQQVLKQDSPVMQGDALPFADDKDVPAKKIYRYRKITIPPFQRHPTDMSLQQKPVTLIVRTEIDAVLPDNDKGYLFVRALNEYNGNVKNNWASQLETHYGALIAQEAKNNHCKVAKWVSQAMIGGCEQIKIGFVTRANPNQNDKHIILSVQSYRVKDLGLQIGMQQDNVWGIIRFFIDLLLSQPDGDYTLVKDPVKPELKLYRTQAAEPEESPEIAEPMNLQKSPNV